MAMNAEDTPAPSADSTDMGVKSSGDVGESIPKGRIQENLLSKVVNVGGRYYYLDVRKNNRGEYLKLTEASQNREGGRSRRTLLLSGHLVGRLNQVLSDVIAENYDMENVGEPDENWSTIFSRRAVTSQKKIYFDLMHNKTGRSLNIAEVPQDLSTGRKKTAVIVSEQGWLQLKRALDEISEEFPLFKPQLSRGPSNQLDSKKIQIGNKRFFLDLIENQLGRFLKLSEVKPRKRDTIFLPFEGLEVLSQLLENLEKGDLTTEIEGLETSALPETEKEGQKTLLRTSLTFEAEDEGPVESHTFFIDFRENEHGKFLRIVERKPGRSSAVFIPADGFGEIKAVLDEFSKME